MTKRSAKIDNGVNRSLIKVFLAGLVIRLFLAPFLGHPFDLRVFMAVGWAVARGITPYGQYTLQDIFSNMPQPNLYGTFCGIGYPPPWGLILGLMYLASSTLSPNNIYAYTFALKVPIILGDMITAFLIYKILKSELDAGDALKASSLYLLCPYLISVGVVWGMFDVLPFLFSLLSAYYLLKRRELSSVFLAVACSLKPIPLVLVPLYSIFVYKSTHSVRKASYYFFSVIGLFTVLTMVPMIAFNWPLSNLYYALFYQVSAAGIAYSYNAGYTYGAASPFNLFNMFRLLNLSFEPYWILNYLWIGACLIAYLYAARRIFDLDFASVTRWSLLILLIFFTTRSWVSDQNLLFLFSFFLLTLPLHSFFSISWKTIHALWILFFVFVMFHVPAIAFLWIPYPWTLNAASAFCDGPMGFIRLIAMTGLTFTWLCILWHYVARRVMWR
jgi:hypothetical protein